MEKKHFSKSPGWSKVDGVWCVRGEGGQTFKTKNRSSQLKLSAQNSFSESHSKV